jgi:hypothetical protein
MKIKLGLGNLVTYAFNPTAKTLAVTGAYNFDIEPQNLEVYDIALSAYIYGGDSTASATVARTYTVASRPLQTVTFSAVPSGAASGDTLSVYCEVPDNVAIYNALTDLLP